MGQSTRDQLRSCALPCLPSHAVIVASSHWESHLPDIVEAIVLPAGKLRNKKEQRLNERKAREVHTAFLRNYGRSATQTPLVRFDVGMHNERPFTEVI